MKGRLPTRYAARKPRIASTERARACAQGILLGDVASNEEQPQVMPWGGANRGGTPLPQKTEIPGAAGMHAPAVRLPALLKRANANVSLFRKRFSGNRLRAERASLRNPQVRCERSVSMRGTGKGVLC